MSLDMTQTSLLLLISQDSLILSKQIELSHETVTTKEVLSL